MYTSIGLIVGVLFIGAMIHPVNGTALSDRIDAIIGTIIGGLIGAVYDVRAHLAQRRRKRKRGDHSSD